MREILFRGRHDGKWVTGDYTSATDVSADGTVKQHFIIDERRHTYAVDPDTVGQYIGANDINGNLIFEGDIVEVPGEDGYFLLKWDSDAVRFSMEGNGLYFDFDNFWAYEIEVIGNIYDNPELMGGTE